MTPEREKEIRALEAQCTGHPETDAIGLCLRDLLAEVDRLRAAFLQVAQAVGVVYSADGHAEEAGPIDEVVGEVRRLVAQSAERDEARADRVLASTGGLLLVHRYEIARAVGLPEDAPGHEVVAAVRSYVERYKAAVERGVHIARVREEARAERDEAREALRLSVSAWEAAGMQGRSAHDAILALQRRIEDAEAVIDIERFARASHAVEAERERDEAIARAERAGAQLAALKARLPAFVEKVLDLGFVSGVLTDENVTRLVAEFLGGM